MKGFARRLVLKERQKATRKWPIGESHAKIMASCALTFFLVPVHSFHCAVIISLSAPENNPGWYLPEDDGTGGVPIQRRNMPLLKDNSSLFLLSQKSKVCCVVVFIEYCNSLR